MYLAKFTDTGEKTKTITRKTFGAGQDLTFTVTDENGTAINLSGYTTNMKISIGVEGTLSVDSATLADVTVASGKVKYPLVIGDFSTEGEVGTHSIELQFADNANLALAAKIIRVGGLSLTVVDTIID